MLTLQSPMWQDDESAVDVDSSSDPQKHARFLPHRHLYLRFMSFFQILKSASNSQIYDRFSLSQIDIQRLKPPFIFSSSLILSL
jgi:hypothetical protein